MRLFLALDVDADTIAGVHTWIARMRHTLGGAEREIAFVDPDRLHITLQFLGEVEPRLIDALVAALALPLPLQPFEAALGDPGAFPRSGAPRVVWVGLARGRDQAIALHDALGPRLREAGVPPADEARPFFPHVTLGRVRRTARPAAGRALRAAMVAVGPPQGSWTIDRVTLYQSVLSPRGPRYTSRAACQLVSVD
jgi:2'-5' RNA ligase